MGLGSLSLWTLDVVRRRVGMVAWSGVGRGLLPSVLGAGLCIFLWIRRRIRIWLRSRMGRMGRFWLAADWSLRSLLSMVGGIRWPVRLCGLQSCRRGQPLWGNRATAWRHSVLERSAH